MDMDFEDILLEVGDNGRYQKQLILFFMLPYASLIPWFSMNIIFMLSEPDHWCKVPEVVNSNLTIAQQRQLISPPVKSGCNMYDINYTDYLTSGSYIVPNDTAIKHCDNGWEYDKTNYDATAVTQWDLYCEDSHYKEFVLTLESVGSMIGTPIYGTLSDKIGRRITFFIILTLAAFSALTCVLMSNFTAFVAIRMINGSLYPNVFQLPYVIVVELVAPELRTHMNGIVNCFWVFGLCFLPLIAYLTRNWVTLGLITSSVILLFFIYWRFLPESPRWLLSQGRYEDTLKVMQKIGEVNGKKTDPDELLAKIKIVGEKIEKEKTDCEVKNTSTDFFKYPQLRKIFIIICICWSANVISYNGIQLNSSNLEGNEFLIFFLTAVVEFPGYAISWYCLDKFGRRWFTVAAFLLTGVICLLPAAILELPYADIICSMFGKFCSSASFMATYQQSAELFPTVVRSLGMGMSSTVATVVYMAVPYITFLGEYGKAIPFVIFGLVSIIAAIAASFLPETLNENLPQTILDVEEFGKNLRYFSRQRRKKSICRERAASLAASLRIKDLQSKETKNEDL